MNKTQKHHATYSFLKQLPF